MNNRDLTSTLLSERNKLASIIRDAQKRLQKAPEGSVRIIKHRNDFQFFLRNTPEDKTGTYIPISERQLAISLIQKRYDTQVIASSEKQLRVIDKFLKNYNPKLLQDIYSSMSAGRKAYTKPFELPDQEYISEWLSFDYVKKEFSEDDPEHYTSKGERVRSKSEVMIADALEQMGIPYRYECPLDMSGRILYPDFTLLRIEDRKTLYWEHLGMMDDPVYCQNALRKLRIYEAHEIFPGINLILTIETSCSPINTAVIKRMIKTYCI